MRKVRHAADVEDSALPELAVCNDCGGVWSADVLLHQVQSPSVALEETLRRTNDVAAALGR